MSDNIKPVELSAEELDNVAGGAFSLVDAHNFNAIDQQAGATVLGANGGISSLNTQQTAVSEQNLFEIKATGFFPSTLES
ncbi:MAG: CTB family bacteriocin [Nostoc sp.]|uniref:CTB family bacteriocin n=1 Tax=Nostoc sp. TaxID=1180 RepID=UPI002FFBCBA6